jgi:hypothetical membrane protein
MKNECAPSMVITTAVFFFFIAIITAQLFTPQSYSWTQNTVSELAAQGYDKAWIMQMGLIGYGIILGVGIILRLIGTIKFIFPDLLVMLYGAAIFLSGMYATAPFEKGVAFSTHEASLHSLFATLAGICISISMISYFFAEDAGKSKVFHFVSLVLVVGLSALFGLSERGSVAIGKGIIQRTMYLFGLTWILINYNYLRRKEGNPSQSQVSE